MYIANHCINTEIYKNMHVPLKIMHFKSSTLMLNYICVYMCTHMFIYALYMHICTHA